MKSDQEASFALMKKAIEQNMDAINANIQRAHHSDNIATVKSKPVCTAERSMFLFSTMFYRKSQNLFVPTKLFAFSVYLSIAWPLNVLSVHDQIAMCPVSLT
ncbi:hypothetical protein SUGI_1048170 [Cryptomeria japonica]|nr:hypothetical protein SUGI_1048170 [Cryptomeria japonica]